MSECQTIRARLAETLLILVGMLCLSSTRASAQDMEAVAVDLAQHAVRVYHPRVNGTEVMPSDVSVKRVGESVHTFVRVSWESGWPRRRRRLHTAEIQATFLIQPKRSLVYEMDYFDTDSGLLAHRDYTPQIIAEYNSRLKRSAGLAPGTSIFGPGAPGVIAAPAEELFSCGPDGGWAPPPGPPSRSNCSIPVADDLATSSHADSASQPFVEGSSTDDAIPRLQLLNPGGDSLSPRPDGQ